MWMLWIVALLALVLSLAALAVLVRGQQDARRRHGDVDLVPADLVGLRQEVAALQREVAGAVRHVAIVRYDAFGDMGGHLSWSLALLDDAGDGVLLTSIHGRSEARTYARTVIAWECEQQLSPEEAQTLAQAKG